MCALLDRYSGITVRASRVPHAFSPERLWLQRVREDRIGTVASKPLVTFILKLSSLYFVCFFHSLSLSYVVVSLFFF